MESTAGNGSRSGAVSERILARECHYIEHFGPITQPVAHSTDEQPVHVDIYEFEPTQDRRQWTFVTSGMSDLRQRVPNELLHVLAPRSEIVLYAPGPRPWIPPLLQRLAEYPSKSGTWLHWYHTWTADAPLMPEHPEFTGYVFLPPRLEDPSINNLHVEGDRVDFLWMLPITIAERDFAAGHGAEHLEWLLMHRGVDLTAGEFRPPVV
ncbi:MAG: hypothetical protein AMXMBFR84_48290 [Candidatus Hydrogenedentota bacterium]